MSRRYPTAELYDDRATDFYARPRTERNYDELDIDIDINERRSRAPPTVLSDRRTERGPRQPDFLREDYGKSQAGPMVLRNDRRDDDAYSRAPTRRRSLETVRSKAPPQRVDERELVIRERSRERERRPPYPPSERGGDFREEEIIFRDQARSRAPSRPPPGRSKEEIDIDININHDHHHRDRSRSDVRSRAPPARSEYAKSEAPRSEYRERDVEEIRFRRGGGGPPPPRNDFKEEIDIDIREQRRGPPPRNEFKEEIDIDIREQRRPSPPRTAFRGREDYREKEEIDIRIRESERSAPPPRQRSMSRGQLVGRKQEEWIIRRQRSPSPPPPPRDYEKEEIIIRRRERTPTPEPVREPTPPPPPPPPPEPIVRPPIIQEVITHHRHIDHGVERFREPTPEPPPPPPAPPSPPHDDNLEIEIHRSGMRNGKRFDENIDIDIDQHHHHRDRSRSRPATIRRRSHSASTRRAPSPPPMGPPARRQARPYEDDIAAEADYYNRRVSSRAYPGEAYNGATKDWALVDVPPGTERVRMDGIGGGSQEISWQRYNGERRSKFITGDRMYEDEFGVQGRGSPAPAALPPPPAPSAPPREREREREPEVDIRITERRIHEETRTGGGGKTKERMWTEITKDLVIKEAIEERGYEYEETEDFFYVIEYLRYEDVLRLVELTEDIRRERRERIREIQWEREELERKPKMLPAPAPLPPPPPPPLGGNYDERIYEREYIYDRDGRRYRR